MKRKKVTCFTSLTLAALLTVSSITGSAVNVFATSGDDSIQITTETDNDEIVIENNSEDITISEPKPSDNIVPSTPESTEPNPADEIVIQDTVKSSISLKKDASDTDEIIIENDDSHVAGEEIPVYVKAENPSDTEVELQISFWSGVEKLEDIQSEDLTDIANDITIKEFQKDTKISIDLQSEDKTIKSEANLVQEKDENDNLTKYDISVKMPAKTSADMTFHITSDTAQMVTVVPCMGDIYGTAVHAVWTEADEIEIKDTETESQTEPEIIIEEEKIEDSFPSVYLGDTDLDTATLNASDFASMRLVLFTEDESVIPNESDILSQHDNIYLLQFTSIQQTMNAYAYFKNKSLPVEPDMPVEVAGEDTHNEIVVSKDALQISEKENPIDTLNDILSDTDTSDDEIKVQDDNVIALIDTGVGESPNVIERISVIDDVLTSTGHGDSMLQAIVSQNPDAKILSIRAMNSNGFGTISSLVAAMEYAISENVDMINLSLYARTTLSTSVLKSEIQKAVDAGITVIGAAGNDGVDVMDYVPGSVEPAYIIGAAKEDGSRLETSNFGTTVDYNVVAESTSEATALFTGYISKNGLDKVSEVLNQGMIFETGFGGEEPEISTKEWNQSECNLVSAQYDRTKGAVRLEDLDVPGWLLLTVDSQEGYFIKDVILSDSNMVYYPYEVSAFGEYSQFAFRIPQEHLRIEISYVNNSDDIPEVSFPNSYTPDKQHLVNIEKDTQELRKSDILYHNLETGDSRGNQVINVIGGEILGEDNIQAASWESQSTNFVNGGRINYEGHVTTWMWADDRIAFCARPNAPTPPMGTYKFDASWQNPWDIYSRLMYCMYGGEGFESSGVKSLFQQFGWTSSEQQYAYSHVIMTLAGNNPVAIDQDNFDRNSFSPSCFTGLSNASVDNVLYVVHHIVRNVKTVPAGFKTVMFARDTPYQAVFGSYAAPAKGGLSVQKASADTTITNGNTNYSLAGAQYGIWNNASCSGNPLLTITTDGNGYAKTAEDALDAGTYYVKETKASPGYALDPTIHRKVVVAGDPGIGNSVQSKEPPKTGEGELEKKSDNPVMTDGNNCYSLAGAVYGVWKNSSCSGTPWKRMTTDAKGHAKVDKLPFGNYWVKEITPSKGFELDTNVYPISITETKPKATIRSVEPAGNDPAGIEVTKIWNGPETPTVPPLAGTQFTICYYDDYFTKSNLPDYDSYNSTAKRKWVIEVKWDEDAKKYTAALTDEWLVDALSDELYRDKNGMPILPLGTISIQETKSAPGYDIDGKFTDSNGNIFSAKEKYVTQIVDSQSGVAIQGGNKYKGENKPHPNKIRIRKVDENGNPLAGATFTLMNSKGEIVSTKTSGSDGYVVWEDLYPDRYTVTEIKTKDGKNLLKDPIVIELPRRISDEDIKKYNIDKSNLSEKDPTEGKYFLFDVEYEISNHATFEAPSTGGFTDFMTFLPLVGGMAGMTGVGVIAMKRKRKKK